MSRTGMADLPERLGWVAALEREACAEALPGVTVPPRLHAQTLRRLPAYKTKIRALCGLTAQERRTLHSMARDRSGGAAGGVAAAAGMHLVREWNARTYRVAVTEAGFFMDVATFASFSVVAKGITGTARSGQRFFGLT